MPEVSQEHWIRIDRVEDPRLAPYRLVGRKGAPSDPERFVAEGRLAVAQLLASTIRPDSILATPTVAPELTGRLEPETPLYVAPPELLRSLVGYRFHRGCLACAGRPEPGEDALLALQGMERTLTVVAERVSDQANLGALARNARAFGVDLLVLDPGCADPFARKAIRASVGSIFHLPRICLPVPEAADRLRHLLGPECQILAAIASGDMPLGSTPSAKHRVLLLGNEGVGLSPEALGTADHRIRIETAPELESLNVAAASAILLHHLGSAS